MKDSNGRPDEEVAREFWDGFRLRNDSIIVDLMYGQYKSTVTCKECGKISNNFDPFMTLSLPIPKKIDFEFYYDQLPFFEEGGNRKEIFDLTQALQKEDDVGTLKQIVRDSIKGAEEKEFQIYSCIGGKIKAVYGPKTSVADMDHEKTYIVAQEIEPSFPGSFILEFRFFSLTSVSKRLEVVADTKVFPKRIRVSFETKIGDLKKKLYTLVKYAMENTEADE